MVKQLLFAHSIPGHPRPMGRPHLTWMDTAMHDMGSLGHMLQIDLPRDWANLALYRDVWRGVVGYLWTAGLRASSEDYVVTTRKQPREWKQLLLRPPGVRSSRS